MRREKVWLIVRPKRAGVPSETKNVVQATQPRRRGWVVVSSYPADDPPPRTSDARAWDEWRRRVGAPLVR